MIFMTIGLMPGAVVATLPRRVYYAAQRILRPAESAVRRLIFMRAQGMAAPEVKSRPGSEPNQKKPRGTSAGHLPAFCLIDPRKNFDNHRAQLRSIYDPPPVPVPPLPEDDPIDSKQLFQPSGAPATRAGRSAGTGDAHGPRDGKAQESPARTRLCSAAPPRLSARLSPEAYASGGSNSPRLPPFRASCAKRGIRAAVSE